MRINRKNRPDPITEGSLKTIYELFFGKLVFYKPDSYTLKDWMEYLFDLKNRDVTRYIARKPFRMPGLFHTAANVKIQGIGFRTVAPKAELWVRTDARNPDIIEVEWLAGRGKADQMFTLNSSEWGWVKLRIEEKERRRHQV